VSSWQRLSRFFDTASIRNIGELTMEQHYTCYPIRNDSASPEELQNGLRIGAPVRNGFLAAAWQVQATARLRLPNMHSNCDGATIPSRMWTLHFAAPANNSIHYLPLCGGCCCSKKDGPAMIGQKGRFRCCNRTTTKIHRYTGTSPETEQPNQNPRANQTNTNLCKSLTRAHPTSHAGVFHATAARMNAS
jgi:hypothetical protein